MNLVTVMVILNLSILLGISVLFRHIAKKLKSFNKLNKLRAEELDHIQLNQLSSLLIILDYYVKIEEYEKANQCHKAINKLKLKNDH